MNWEFQRKLAVCSLPSSLSTRKLAPDVKRFGASLRILFRWKQSVYKMIWKHVLLYYAIYVMLSCIEHFALDDTGKEIFGEITRYCSKRSKPIYLTIMLGFFTSTAIQRFFSTLIAMPGTYSTTAMFIMSLKPNVPECRPMIASYARWQVLSWVLTFRAICKPLRRVFPDMMSLQRIGLLLPQEKLFFDQQKASGNDTPKSLMVVEWMLMLLRECQEQKYYFYEPNLLKNVEAVMSFKKKCSNMLKFSLYNIPRPLIQAVVIAVYSLGVLTILGRSRNDFDCKILKVVVNFFPLVPTLQFFVYFSWLALGCEAVNPFGEDASDINISNFAINHIKDSERLVALYDSKLTQVFQPTLMNHGRQQIPTSYKLESEVIPFNSLGRYLNKIDSESQTMPMRTDVVCV